MPRPAVRRGRLTHEAVEVVLCRMAARLEGRGYPDAMNSTPGWVLFRSRIVEEEDARSMKRSAVGARVAQYKKQDWNAFFKDDKGD